MLIGFNKPAASLALLVIFSLPASRAQAQSAPPRIFYSDLVSGPNTGGQANLGAIVTIWGKNFGGAQNNSTVTIGNGLAARYLLWTDQRISFQLGSDSRSGEILVHRSGFAASNGMPFEIRPGRIFFVAVNGGSSGGSFEHPWKSLVHAKNSMKPGDITYVMDGVTQTGEENYSAALSIESGGTKEKPMALVAYPGAHAVVATTEAPGVG
ncbi:MAG: IPT/TIG domain-containing protein, partial [Candidatus Acidiferrales bacterium]